MSASSLSHTAAYAQAALDRAAALRRDPDFLARALVLPERMLLPLWRGRHAVIDEGPRLWSWPVARPLPDHAAPEVFLGLGLMADGQPDQTRPWFALDLSALPEPPDLGVGIVWRDLREVGPLLPVGDATTLAEARGLVHWHGRHLYCGVCGAPTVHAEAGHRRDCINPDCATPHFPRTDPAVIMLVLDDQDRALLGHGPRMPEGMLTTLAGFVEPGETLEQAVAREVLEEAGVRIGPPVYRGSQPWPFPGSLMVGFTARAETTVVNVDPQELTHAAWYSRAEVRAFSEVADGGPGPKLPRRDSIARQLIEAWLREG